MEEPPIVPIETDATGAEWCHCPGCGRLMGTERTHGKFACGYCGTEFVLEYEPTTPGANP